MENVLRNYLMNRMDLENDMLDRKIMRWTREKLEIAGKKYIIKQAA
jgi:hypothetical protein